MPWVMWEGRLVPLPRALWVWCVTGVCVLSATGVNNPDVQGHPLVLCAWRCLRARRQSQQHRLMEVQPTKKALEMGVSQARAREHQVVTSQI